MRTLMEKKLTAGDMGWLHEVLRESGLLEDITRNRKGRTLTLQRATVETDEDGWPELNLFGELGEGPAGEFVVSKKIEIDVLVIAKQPAENAPAQEA